MKHKGAELVYKKIANLTKAEQLSLWSIGTKELRKKTDSLKIKSSEK